MEHFGGGDARPDTWASGTILGVVKKELQRRADGISQRMLTTTLRHLERDGFLKREVFPEVPPRVEYEMTSLGLSLLRPMEHLVAWIGNHWPAIKQAREQFDRKMVRPK